MQTATHLGGDHVSPEQPFNNFAARLIRRKARELAARSGFSPSDRDDIEQELRLVLVRRLDKFDPSVAHYNAFVTTVIERYSATILEHRRAESRPHGEGRQNVSCWNAEALHPESRRRHANGGTGNREASR